MEYVFIWNTLGGYLVALFIDILQRDKDSKSSPVKLDLWFFLKDNKIRLIFSFLLSLMITMLIVINAKDAVNLFGKEEFVFNNLIYIIVGAVPDVIIAYVKNKTKWLRPDKVDGYVRK